MHKITTHNMEELTNYETDDYHPELHLIDDVNLGLRVDCFLNDLEQLKQLYFQYKEQGDMETANKYWKELIRWTPTAWLQTRTVTLNYENIRSMINQRKTHKLCEWSDDFIGWCKTLPYAKELLFDI